MDYTTLQTIAIVCYMVSGGFLAVSVLIFFLWDMRDIIGRLTGSSERKALARMRSGEAFGRTGANVVDMSALEKGRASTAQSSGRLSRRSGRVNKGQQDRTAQPAPARAAPPPRQSVAPDYFGAPYPNKTPPAPVAPPPRPAAEPQTELIEQPPRQTLTAVDSETMDLKQWQTKQRAENAQAPAPKPDTANDDDIEPVKMTILDDIMLVHTESFIEL